MKLGQPDKTHHYRDMDIVLTGLPRSGTTLTCSLLNKCPDVVALDEPMEPRKYKGLSPDEMIAAVRDFYSRQRLELLTSRKAASKTLSGSIPSNSYGPPTTDGALRHTLLSKGELLVDKALSDSLTLVIKHPAFFTATLTTLTRAFKAFAIIRNPLAVLLSWNSVAIPAQNGRMHVAELFSPKLQTLLAKESDRISRQIVLLDWCFQQYTEALPATSIIRYEDIVESQGRILSSITSAAASLSDPLKSSNVNSFYDWTSATELGARLLATDGFFWRYYSRKEVIALIETKVGRV